MGYPIKWIGYGRYTNTGSRFRRWEITEAIKELEAERGDALYDHGPERGDGGRRFVVEYRSREKPWPQLFVDEETVTKTLFEGHLPVWDPPVEHQGSGGLGPDDRLAVFSLAEAARSLLQAIDQRQKTAEQEPAKESDKPHPRGVYWFESEGRWDRDLLVAYGTDGKVVAKLEVEADDTPEDVACIASSLQRTLDRKDPLPAPIEFPTLEDVLAAGEAPCEAYGLTILRQSGAHWLAFNRFVRWQGLKPRECADCGDVYRPDDSGRRPNTRSCRACIEARRSRRKSGGA